MPASAAAAPNPLSMLPMFVMVFVIFYFLVFQPQSKARKDHERMLKELKKFDEVVTSGGIFGTVMDVRPEAVTLRIDENVRVKVEPSAIARVAKPKAQPAAPVVAGKVG